MQHRVFIYGTLKRGFPNHACMDGATFICTARTAEAYPMIVQGSFYSPVIIPEPGHGHRVAGEIWEVDDTKLAALDRLESTHLPSGYIRQQIAVVPIDGGPPQTVWAYFKPRDRITIVHSEPHEDYQDRRYVPASKRPT